MRYVKGHFVLTGPDVPSMRFKEAEDERKLASALIVFSAFRVSNPPTRPGETAQNLMSSARPVDTICRKPCRSRRVARAQLTLETVSEHAFGQIGAKFSRQLKRI